MGLAGLPRVLKGYSDTLLRGKIAYDRIMTDVVRPAVADGKEVESFRMLRDAVGAALSDETHAKLEAVLGNQVHEPEIPQLKQPAHA